ncbi:MAG: HDIG domain-containing metalloprotein [Thermotaleaceae bacterium]
MSFLKYFKDKMRKNFLIRFLCRKGVSYSILAFVFFIVIFFSIINTLAPEKYELQPGQKAPVDLRAPRDIEDKGATEKLIKKAIESVEPRERVDPTIQIDVKKNIERFFLYLYQVRELEETAIEEKLELLKEAKELELTDEQMVLMLSVSEREVRSMESYIYEVITQVMSTGIKTEELDKEKTNITNYFMSINDFSEKVRVLGIHIVNSSLRANRFLVEETTQQKIEEAKKNVEKIIIRRGSIIVNDGEIITEEKYDILKDAGLTKEDGNIDFSLYIGIAVLVLICQIILISYLLTYDKGIFQSLSKLYLIVIIFLSVYVVSQTIYGISTYLAPVAAAAMLLGILIDTRFAMIANLIMTIFLGIITGNNWGIIVTSLIAGTVGAFSVSHTHQRSNIFFAGLMVSVSNMIIIFGLGLMNSTEMSKILLDSLYGGVNGVFCAILTIGSLPLWESTFDILTPLKLLELSNPNQPVLKKLLLEAPGTYHHSIIVGNLSEAAADAIGANGLLARVSAYYHDIGKLKRPYFFKENQLTSENPHDKLTPNLSTLIITSHVKDGIEIGKQYDLPVEILEMIEQHHGTTLVKFFYHKAITEDEKEAVDEENYRYQGSKPKTKEAAIIMLADSVEAAVRSMSEPTAEKIKILIDKIIKDKLEDHQLDECPLTLKDLLITAQSFQTVLMGIFHERIEYPEINRKEVEEAN